MFLHVRRFLNSLYIGGSPWVNRITMVSIQSELQWRRNYGDRGYNVPPQFQDLYPLSARLRTFEAALYKFAHYITLHYPQVKDAAYVKILSKRL